MNNMLCVNKEGSRASGVKKMCKKHGLI